MQKAVAEIGKAVSHQTRSAANVTAEVREEDHREASIITFLSTASGIISLGLGSVLWGVVMGGFAYLVLNKA
ncbi:hypothetical protein N825_31990 [Skermanella stibiiresistens SB22]|uniref:Uncharacterized protein n=1 Tax=Skermanella stibiiresistens SB22 TaxID=1385369 RepID=W9GU65_9PROT|nr:benzoate/H(+) symporter BenE family transporter [Skermanella stibiiresistens]EWY35977.1 hypothetical protein N825_31990 [Skermanella stibiiresistens SB22]